MTTTLIIFLTWAIVKALKTAKLSNRYLPLIALLIGIMLSFIISVFIQDDNLITNLLIGAWSGVASTGANETASKSMNAIVSTVGNLITKSK